MNPSPDTLFEILYVDDLDTNGEDSNHPSLFLSPHWISESLASSTPPKADWLKFGTEGISSGILLASSEWRKFNEGKGNRCAMSTYKL